MAKPLPSLAPGAITALHGGLASGSRCLEQRGVIRTPASASTGSPHKVAALRGEWTDPHLGKTRFADWAAQWEAGRANRRASTRARDGSYLANLILPTFGSVQLSRIEPAEVRAWVSGLAAAGYSAATTRKAYQLLAAALEAAVSDGVLPRSPAKGVPLPKLEHTEMRFLNIDEVDSLAEAVESRYRALLLTAAYTGCRAGELAGLKVDRLNLLKRSLKVVETLSEVGGHLSLGPAKTQSSMRSIKLPSFLCEELALHLATYGSQPFVFTADEGGPIRWSNFRRRVWKPAVTASVGEPMRFHDLRHTHAALLIAQNEHPKVIQQRLGHASIKTTLDTYGHLFDGLDEAAADRLDEAFTGSRGDKLVTLDRGEVVNRAQSG